MSAVEAPLPTDAIIPEKPVQKPDPIQRPSSRKRKVREGKPKTSTVKKPRRSTTGTKKTAVATENGHTVPKPVEVEQVPVEPQVPEISINEFEDEMRIDPIEDTAVQEVEPSPNYVYETDKFIYTKLPNVTFGTKGLYMEANGAIMYTSSKEPFGLEKAILAILEELKLIHTKTHEILDLLELLVSRDLRIRCTNVDLSVTVFEKMSNFLIEVAKSFPTNGIRTNLVLTNMELVIPKQYNKEEKKNMVEVKTSDQLLSHWSILFKKTLLSSVLVSQHDKNYSNVSSEHGYIYHQLPSLTAILLVMYKHLSFGVFLSHFGQFIERRQFGEGTNQARQMKTNLTLKIHNCGKDDNHLTFEYDMLHDGAIVGLDPWEKYHNNTFKRLFANRLIHYNLLTSELSFEKHVGNNSIGNSFRSATIPPVDGNPNFMFGLYLTRAFNIMPSIFFEVGKLIFPLENGARRTNTQTYPKIIELLECYDCNSSFYHILSQFLNTEVKELEIAIISNINTRIDKETPLYFTSNLLELNNAPVSYDTTFKSIWMALRGPLVEAAHINCELLKLRQLGSNVNKWQLRENFFVYAWNNSEYQIDFSKKIKTIETFTSQASSDPVITDYRLALRPATDTLLKFNPQVKNVKDLEIFETYAYTPLLKLVAFCNEFLVYSINTEAKHNSTLDYIKYLFVRWYSHTILPFTVLKNWDTFSDINIIEFIITTFMSCYDKFEYLYDITNIKEWNSLEHIGMNEKSLGINYYAKERPYILLKGNVSKITIIKVNITLGVGANTNKIAKIVRYDFTPKSTGRVIGLLDFENLVRESVKIYTTIKSTIN